MPCSKEWWDQQDNEEKLLGVLQRSFPQIPTAWLQACAAGAVGREEHSLKCALVCACTKPLLLCSPDNPVQTEHAFVALFTAPAACNACMLERKAKKGPLIKC
jgi:hypothetical protein